MTILRKLTLGTLLFTAISANAASVWKVSKGDSALYIGGTIHILRQENFPLPAEYETAYAKADELYFETDIAATKLPSFQQKMMSKIVLTDGTTLESYLTPETFSALKKHMDSRGLPIANFQPLKPAAVALTLSVLEYQANGFLQEGVDAFYASKATADNKPQKWLESVDEQLNFIANMGEGDEENLIKYTLEDLGNMSSQLEQLLTVWKSGDMKTLNTLMIKEMQIKAPDLYNDLLKERNNNWMPKIVQMFDDNDTEFVLVGAAHLAGEDSVLNKLKEQGFSVEQL
ncbi:TraB/GumN family protein [Alteromonas sp. 5E99-2]|uniref:TraB/GumN family protein n=1 Tax=Alteromonas sp. 5E99-2 TaxID=2817683 RepID=UPI001A993DF9|nr:TraB/GumN family protein [Alteromonas sp. 5E99-2]MBO1256293.1 TraB/GumN family protein [Alteromonas sp. 5E99-2]